MTLKYCSQCVYPATKPELYFDEHGVCSACLAFEARQHKDWKHWEQLFHGQVSANKSHSVYDCIIPVSGGKDSTYQVLKVLSLGYNPLCVNARTDDLSDLGRQNLDNIANLGVDLIEVNTNRVVRKKLARHSLLTVGDISWAEHVSIFTVPFSVACQYGIKLIIYGENPQNEYGAGPKGTEKETVLGYDWLQEFGGLNGLRVDDVVSSGVATDTEMFQYRMPDSYALESIEPRAIFLGQFFEWDGFENAKLAREYGFKVYDRGNVEGTGVNYENLDNHYTGIHDYFRYIKFGYNRGTDIMCNNIRRKRILRNEAKMLIPGIDNNYPYTYLGKHLFDILDELVISYTEFRNCVVDFTNKELFEIGVVDDMPYPLFYGDLLKC